jgi:hypothetical protein
MGQQQTVGSSALRRIILVLTVAALMAAMLVASAMPAFAAKPAFADHPGEKDFAGPELGQSLGECNQFFTGSCRATPNKPH